ncbi:hypothetical protein SAMN05421856_103400 [Chryseobacterium taichungense]|uniref:Uncharacterized protein n=1 Tax=Chryseobacterium taichungense TaxID=295069 RepID=A0A1H7YL00_9FLAO|nr:hypothetical protein [Chryseobacterium taichungense]SEM46936.1 hypothetical protein SAMN05421856_103400 [Chryseobacterium taichungense]
MRKESDDFSKKLEGKTAESETKEVFDDLENELEERIPKETKIEDLKAKGNPRKNVTISNIDDIGKQAAKVEFQLVDELGFSIGKIERESVTYGGVQRRLNYKIKLKKIFSKDSQAFTTLMNKGATQTYDLPMLPFEDIMYADFNITTRVTSEYSGLGELMLDDAYKFYSTSKDIESVDGLFGVWLENADLYSGYGGKSVNLIKFWEAVDAGKSYEEAAFETFTGQWSRKNGFTKIIIKYVEENITLQKL